MERIRTYLASRIFWLVFWLGLGLLQVIPNLGTPNFSKVLTGAGLICLGLVCFLQPPLLNLPISSATSRAKDIAVGPSWLRITLVAALVICTLFGLFLRYSAKA
jgi:hypothetical protein